MYKYINQLKLALVVLPFIFGVPGANAADIKERAIKLAHPVPRDNPLAIGAIRYVEIVTKKSEGKLKVKDYPEGSLGSEVASVSSAQGGIIEMVLIASSTAVSVVKEFGVFDLPFVFANEKEVAAVVDGPIGRQLLDKFSEKGLVGLCYWELGFRNISNSRRPITKLDDFRGLKIRSVPNPVLIDTYAALGANPTPMAFTELFGALEMKSVDGAELPYTTFSTSRLYEVQKYISETRMTYVPVVMLASKKFWDSLSADEKGILQDSCAESRDYQRKVQRDLEAKLRVELKGKGLLINDVAPVEIAKMRAQVKSVIDKHTPTVGEDLVKKVLAEVEKVRAQK